MVVGTFSGFILPSPLMVPIVFVLWLLYAIFTSWTLPQVEVPEIPLGDANPVEDAVVLDIPPEAGIIPR